MSKSKDKATDYIGSRAWTDYIGSRAWKESVPEPIREPLAKALWALEEDRVGDAMVALGEAWNVAVENNVMPRPIVFFGGEAAVRAYFVLKGKDPTHPNVRECEQMALALLEAMYVMNPSDFVARHQYARFLHDLGREAEAVPHYRHALLQNPKQIETRGNLGTALYTIGDKNAGRDEWDKCLSLKAKKPSEDIAQCYLELRRGNYVKGWRQYQSRWRDRAFADGYGRKDLDAKGLHWTEGELPDDHALYVHGEQGLGDHVQFLRYVPLLLRRGVRVVGVETRPILYRWTEAALPGVKVYVRDQMELPEFTHHVSTLDLPHLLGTTVETIPEPLAPAA